VKVIKSALISVFDKTGLEDIALELNKLGVVIYSTGGTQSFLEGLGISVVPVEDLTSYPSILGGRVKTLHPKVFGGILGRRELNEDLAQLEEYEIPEIDLVIVDLYPFEQTVASGAKHEDIIEKIDIGGISLIRAAAKNYKDVVIVPSQKQYGKFLQMIRENGGATTLDERMLLSKDAFNVSSHYDTQIYGYFAKGDIASFKQSVLISETLRYGENPHQQGVFYGDLDAIFEKHNGKELSYNNLLDVDAAVNLMGEFAENETAFAILKHNNACGLSMSSTVEDAYSKALAGDPVSAFGGVLITNATVNLAAARLMNDLFFEVLIAPAYEKEALDLLCEKKNRIVLTQKHQNLPKIQFRTALNGVLYQDKDLHTETSANFEVRTNVAPSDQEVMDLVFANKIVKHTKSNTIVLAKNGQLLASGTGQTSRFDLKGAVMASDAFFPFPDCVEIAFNAGITAVVQPGGSIKDQLSIDYCNQVGMAMVFTGVRHFKH
jgi:phosphoribosylaminoimidazolecarboxamide formyltransferase / IMP cyclohydrolase